MENARRLPEVASRRHLSSVEASIRTLGVSLLAVAAVAAGVFLSRQKQPERAVPPATGEEVPQQFLDALRAAGF
jgi:hypothetical protein